MRPEDDMDLFETDVDIISHYDVEFRWGELDSSSEEEEDEDMDDDTPFGNITMTIGDGPKYAAVIARIRRDNRKSHADDFRRKYNYGSGIVKKTIVCCGGTHIWTDKTYGITWVGVHGSNSICVVTKTGDLDVARVFSDLKGSTIEEVLRKFRKTIISELEDLASMSSKLSESFGQSILKPFGVVSVTLGTDSVHKESDHEASSDVYEEDKVMKVSTMNEREATGFLLEKIMKGEASTIDETVKTAISTFQLLFPVKNFKADEIEVSVMDPDYSITVEEDEVKDIYVNHLEISDIVEYLAAINEPGSGSSSSVDSSSERSASRGRTTKFVQESDMSDVEEERNVVINWPCSGGSSSD